MNDDKPRAPRLKTLAAQINAEFPELHARIQRSHCNTDRKIGRLRWPGKGRWGNRLIVVHKRKLRKTAIGPLPLVVLDHDAAETYRSNDEVVRWIECYREERRKRHARRRR